MDPTLITDHPSNAVALVDDGRVVTYGQLRERVARCAAGLVRGGVAPGDCVVVLGHNDATFVTGLLSALAVGAVACPISADNPSDVVVGRLASTGARAILVSPTGAALLPDDASTLAGVLVGAPSGAATHDLLPIDAEPLGAPIDVSPDDAAIVLHTSGIVGASRAAVLTHRNIHAALDRAASYDGGITAADVAYGGLTFAHVYGLNQVLCAHLRAGATVVLQARWDASSAMALITEHKINRVVAVPPMWHAWAHLGGVEPDLLRHVTHARSGASTLHPDIAEAVHRELGIELAQGYGLTETAGTVTIEPHARRRPGSVGRPLLDVEVRLMDRDRPAAPGDRGEIWLRTPSIFRGYLDDPAATAEVLMPEHWCRTGDIGILDDDGTLYLEGRSKDLINVSGFNVYPAEVEAVLQQHPSVRAAVVVGEPHPVSGERVIAYVSSDAPAVDVPAVVEHCRRHLSRYKVPASIHVVDRLPLNALGKRRRAELRTS